MTENLLLVILSKSIWTSPLISLEVLPNQIKYRYLAIAGEVILFFHMATLHPEKVKNILTIATLGDAQADDVILSLWTKRMNVDALLDAFGNVPSTLLNSQLLPSEAPLNTFTNILTSLKKHMILNPCWSFSQQRCGCKIAFL